MLRGYRGIVCALVGLALSGAAPPEKEAVTQQPASQPSPTASLTPDYAPYPRVKADECYQAKDHDTADLCAQWRAAFAAEKSSRVAEWGNWIGGIAAIISAASVILVVLALRQTEKTLKMAQRDRATNTRRAIASGAETAQAIETAKGQLAAMQESANRQLRPYVSITEHPEEEAQSPFSRDSILKIRVVNFGQTPATNVRFSIGGAVAERPIGDYVVTLERSGDYGAIAPGDCRTEKIHVRDLTPGDFGVIAAGKDHMLARIRIDYTWPGGADHHDLTMILTDPATNEWNLLTDERRRHTNDDK